MLLKCCECNSEVSEYAEKCPKCGCPINIIKKNHNNTINRVSNHGKVTWNDGETVDITGIENKILEDELENSALLFDVLSNEFGLEFSDCVSVIDVIKFNNYKLPTNFQETYDAMCSSNQARVERMNASKVHCPFCNSTNVKKISATSRATSVLSLGILSKKIGKQWHCNSCKSDF